MFATVRSSGTGPPEEEFPLHPCSTQSLAGWRYRPRLATVPRRLGRCRWRDHGHPGHLFGNGGILITDEDYGDYEVRFDEPGLEHRLRLFRCTDDGRYQVTVDYRPDGEVGTIYGEGTRLASPNPEWPLLQAARLNALRSSFRREAHPGVAELKIIDFCRHRSPAPAEEGIAVQVHGGGDRDGSVTRFRNIRVRLLGEDEIAH